MKGREYKEYFDTEQGVTFIPWSKLGSNLDLQALSEGGWIDPETLPPGHQNSLNEGNGKNCARRLFVKVTAERNIFTLHRSLKADLQYFSI